MLGVRARRRGQKDGEVKPGAQPARSSPPPVGERADVPGFRATTGCAGAVGATCRGRPQSLRTSNGCSGAAPPPPRLSAEVGFARRAALAPSPHGARVTAKIPVSYGRPTTVSCPAIALAVAPRPQAVPTVSTAERSPSPAAARPVDESSGDYSFSLPSSSAARVTSLDCSSMGETVIAFGGRVRTCPCAARPGPAARGWRRRTLPALSQA